MLGWDLGWSALTTASHTTIILAVLMVFAELLYLQAVSNARTVIDTRAVRSAIALMFSALVVERLYYIAARLLIGTEIDLWSAHPAPELLSLMLAASIFGVAATLMVFTATTLRRGLVGVAIQGGGLVLVWGCVAVALF